MKLQISYNRKKYLAEVHKRKNCFEFKMVKFNDTYSWTDVYALGICNKTLKERLAKYKEFKKRTFENGNGATKFMEMDERNT